MLKKIAVFLTFSIFSMLFVQAVYAEEPEISLDYNSVITISGIPAENEDALVVWINDDSGKTVYANLYSKDEYADAISIHIPDLKIGDSLSLTLTGAYTYSKTFGFDRSIMWTKFKEEYDKIDETSVNALLAEYSELINSQHFESYMKLSAEKQSRVLAAIVNTELASFDDIQKIIDEQTANILNEPEIPNNTPSGNGGSGGSGGGGGASAAGNSSYDIGKYQNKSDNKTQGSTQALNDIQKIKVETEPFSDAGTAPWADESILLLKSLNVINGDSDNKFNPKRAVTRAEFIKMLVMTFDEPDKNLKCSFADVSEKDWYYSYVALAQEFGLAQGNDNLFAPNDSITRQDAAVLIWRFCNFYQKELSPDKNEIKFSDKEEIADYAKTAIDELVSFGIINGMEDGSFVPGGICNRAMAAKMIASIIMSE